MDELNRFVSEQPFISNFLFLLGGAILGAYAKDWIERAWKMLSRWLATQNRNFALGTLKTLEREKALAEHFRRNPVALYNLLWVFALNSIYHFALMILALALAAMFEYFSLRPYASIAFGWGLGVGIGIIRNSRRAIRGIDQVRDGKELESRIAQIHNMISLSNKNNTN